MTFLSPWMLAGAAAVGIPLALHFFYRARYKPKPWGTMKFLRLSIEQTSRRLKFQEWILLFLRVLLVALIALALARPASTSLSGAGRGANVDAVLLLDTSYSMATNDGEMTRFDRAKLAAQKVLDQLPPASTVQIISVTDRATLLGPHSPGNFDQARQILRRMEPTALNTDFLPAIEEALAALDRGTSPNKEVYLFSDLQQSGWEKQSAALRAKASELHDRSALFLVRCGRRTPINVALTELIPRGGIPHSGSRAIFSALVRNSGTEPVRDLTVTLEVAGKPFEKDSQAIPLLGPGQIRAVPLTAGLDQAGQLILQARVTNDDLAADNQIDRVVQVHDRVRMLVVDGAPNEREPERAGSYFLMHALRPVPEPDWATYHIQPRAITPRQAAPALLADKQICLLANVSVDPGGTFSLSDSFIERLERFVREGGGLVITGGPNAVPQAYNIKLQNLLPMPLTDVFDAPEDDPLSPAPESAARASFLAGFAEAPLDQIGQVAVRQALRVKEESEENAPTGQVLLRYRDGTPMVLSRRVGQGEVIFVTTGMGSQWSDWGGRQPSYLPFLHITVSHLLQRSVQEYNLLAGKPIVWRPPTNTQDYSLIRPDGEEQYLERPRGEDADDIRPFTITDTAQAGIYKIVPQEEGDAVNFAVVPDPRESENLSGRSEDEIDALLGFEPVHLTAEADLSEVTADFRLRDEWTMWALLAVFLVLAGESIWAWFCGRPVG